MGEKRSTIYGYKAHISKASMYLFDLTKHSKSGIENIYRYND